GRRITDRSGIEVRPEQRFRDGEEDDLSKKGDVVADSKKPGVRVTNGHIDIDAGKDVAHGQVREGVRSAGEVVGPPGIDRKAGVDRMILVEDRAERGEWRPFVQ